jgi:hypothetical protein
MRLRRKAVSYQGIALAMPQVACYQWALFGAEVSISTFSAASNLVVIYVTCACDNARFPAPPVRDKL